LYFESDAPPLLRYGEVSRVQQSGLADAIPLYAILNEILVRASRAEVREIFLEVRPSNEAALALYRKKGFHHIAERPAYYQAKGGREDAAVLSKVMKKSG
jgi:hypothetical protein